MVGISYEAGVSSSSPPTQKSAKCTNSEFGGAEQKSGSVKGGIYVYTQLIHFCPTAETNATL